MRHRLVAACLIMCTSGISTLIAEGPANQDSTSAPPFNEKEAKKEISTVAQEFFEGLREADRTAAIEQLTAKAKTQAKDAKSPVKQLPRPAEGRKAINVSRATLDGILAEIPVKVKAGGKLHRTKLHLRYEDEQWQVFAMSAMYPEGEKSINYEAEIEKAAEGVSIGKMMGKPMKLTGITVTNRPLNMNRYKGKVVLIDFWATWCGPCLAEMPNVRKNYDKYHDKGFDVVAISLDRDQKKLLNFVAEEKPPWAVVADYHPLNKQRMGAKYGVRGIPAFALIGRDGKVASVNCRGKRLEKEIRRLLAEDAPSSEDKVAAQLD